MNSILLIGDEPKCKYLQSIIATKGFQVEISDGDEEEDFKDYDIIFDLNFDDDHENFPIYASLRDKLIFLSAAKQNLSEMAYLYQAKVRSKIFGINAIQHYLSSPFWEISSFRPNEMEAAILFLQKLDIKLIEVQDIVGMYRPRVDFLAFNETIKLLQEGFITDKSSYVLNSLKQIDQIGVTDIFETLMAIYEDTREAKYLPNTLLKKKYLRNHKFIL